MGRTTLPRVVSAITGNEQAQMELRLQFDAARGALIQGAAPAAAGVAIAALPAVPAAGALSTWLGTSAGTALTLAVLPTTAGAVGVGGTALGVIGTTWSLQHTAETCTLSGRMTVEERWRCGFAVGTSLFSAFSTGVGALAGNVSIVNQASNIARQGLSTAATAEAAGSSVSNALKAGISAQKIAPAGASLQALNRGVSLAGIGVFGPQAVYECSNWLQGKETSSAFSCFSTGALTAVSALRLATGNIQSVGVQRTVGGIDTGQNLVNALAACTSLLQGGQGDIANCAQNAAGLVLQGAGEIATWRPTNVDVNNTTVRPIQDAITAKLVLYDANGNLLPGVTPDQVNQANRVLETAGDIAAREFAQVELARNLVPGEPVTALQQRLKSALLAYDGIPRYTVGEDPGLSVRRQNVINEVTNLRNFVAAEVAAVTQPKRTGLAGVIDAVRSRLPGYSPAAEVTAYQRARERFLEVAGDPNRVGSGEYVAAQAELLNAQKALSYNLIYNERQKALQGVIDERITRLDALNGEIRPVYDEIELLANKDAATEQLNALNEDLKGALQYQYHSLLAEDAASFDTAFRAWRTADGDIIPFGEGTNVPYREFADPTDTARVIWQDSAGTSVAESVVRDAVNAEVARLRTIAQADLADIAAKVTKLNDIVAIHNSGDDAVAAAFGQRRTLLASLESQARGLQIETQAYVLARNKAGTMTDRVAAAFGRGTTVESVRVSLARAQAPDQPTVITRERGVQAEGQRTFRQRILGTGDNPSALGKVFERFGFSVEPPSKIPFAEIFTMARRLASEGKRFPVVENAVGKPRLEYPDGASRRLRSQIDTYNNLLNTFEAKAGFTLRPEQVTLLVAPEAILQLQAGGGKTSVIGPLLAAMERTTVTALPTSTDAVGYVNDIVARRQFFDELGIKIYFYDQQRGFLEVGPNFDRATAAVADPIAVRAAADLAASDPSQNGLMIITESADNAWAQIGGKYADTPASTLMYDMVMGKYDYSLIYDEIGAVAGGHFSQTRGEPVTLETLTDPRSLQGLRNSAEMQDLSESVRTSAAVAEFREAVLTALRDGTAAEGLFFSYRDTKGYKVVRPYPADQTVIGKTYADIIDIVLNRTTELGDARIVTELAGLRDRLRLDPGNESLRAEYEAITKRTGGLTDADRSLLTQIAYMTSDAQARWFVLSRVPGNDFGYELPKSNAERQLEIDLAQANQELRSATDDAGKQAAAAKIADIETRLLQAAETRSGDLVLRKSGGTTGEQYSAAVQKLALHTEGVEMLRAAGQPVDSQNLPATGKIGITPDSDQISNVEIMRYKASRGKLKGYDATPDSASNILGIDATGKSEIPPPPAGYAQNKDTLALIRDASTTDEYRAYTKEKTVAFILADDRGGPFSKQTDAVVAAHGDVEFVARTKLITEPDGGTRTEYFIEKVTRNLDGSISRTPEQRPVTSEEWSAAIHAKLTELGPDGRSKLAIIYEGRTRAVDFRVEPNNKDIRWTIVASDQNTVEDITQSWKRNRVAALEVDLLAAGWTQDEIDAAKQYHLWVRTDQAFTKDTIVGHYQNVLAEQLATARFDAAISGIAKAPERSLVAARDALLATTPADQQGGVRATFDRLIADAQRVERAIFSEIQTKPLTAAEIPTEIYNRAAASHAQLEATVTSLQQQFNLSNDQVTSLRQGFGVDGPFMSRAEFDSLFASPSLARPTNQNPIGPTAYARYWAEMNSPDTIPQAAWSNRTQPDVAQVAARTQAQVSEAAGAGRLVAEAEILQQRAEAAVAVAQGVREAVESGTYTTTTLSSGQRGQLWSGLDALSIAVGQALSAFEEARETLARTTGATRTVTSQRVLRTLQPGDVLTSPTDPNQTATIQSPDQQVVRYPNDGSTREILSVREVEFDTENNSYVLVPLNITGALPNKNTLLTQGGFEFGDGSTTIRTYATEAAAGAELQTEVARLQAAHDNLVRQQQAVQQVAVAEIAGQIKDATGVSLSVSELSALLDESQVDQIVSYLAKVHAAGLTNAPLPQAGPEVTGAIVSLLNAINAGRDIENQFLTSEAYANEILEKLTGPVIAAAKTSISSATQAIPASPASPQAAEEAAPAGRPGRVWAWVKKQWAALTDRFGRAQQQDQSYLDELGAKAEQAQLSIDQLTGERDSITQKLQDIASRIAILQQAQGANTGELLSEARKEADSLQNQLAQVQENLANLRAGAGVVDQTITVELIGRANIYGGISGRSVSRNHALIYRNQTTGVIGIADNNSTSGTYVNGREIFAYQDLKEGDEVRLGSSEKGHVLKVQNRNGQMEIVTAKNQIVLGALVQKLQVKPSSDSDIGSLIGTEKYTTIAQKQAEQLRGNIEIHGGTLLGQKLTVDALYRAGLEPKYKIRRESTQFYISDPYSIVGGRVAFVVYVQEGSSFVARTFYRSNSATSWRYLPGYTLDDDGHISWYSKGFSEEGINAPAFLQITLANILQRVNPKTLNNHEFFFGGTATGRSMTDTFFQNVDQKPEIIRLQSESDETKQLPVPESIRFENEEDAPDFSSLLRTWTEETKLYGRIVKDVFRSKNGKYFYVFYRDTQGRAGIAHVENANSPIVSQGIRKNWVRTFSLDVPIMEYASQVAGYGNKKITSGNYIDMFENYLSKIPVIQEYLRFVDGRAVDQDSGVAAGQQGQSQELQQQLAEETRISKALAQARQRIADLEAAGSSLVSLSEEKQQTEAQLADILQRLTRAQSEEEAVQKIIGAQKMLNTLLAKIREQGIRVAGLQLTPQILSESGRLAAEFSRLVQSVVVERQADVSALTKLRDALMSGVLPAGSIVQQALEAAKVVDIVNAAIAQAQEQEAVAQAPPGTAQATAPAAAPEAAASSDRLQRIESRDKLWALGPFSGTGAKLYKAAIRGRLKKNRASLVRTDITAKAPNESLTKRGQKAEGTIQIGADRKSTRLNSSHLARLAQKKGKRCCTCCRVLAPPVSLGPTGGR